MKPNLEASAVLRPPTPAQETSSPVCWIDGQLVDRRHATLPLTDLAFTRGYAAFDALRTYGGVPFLLEEHLARLEATCAALFLKIPCARGELVRAVSATLKANALPESLIRIYVTGGDAGGFIPENKERLLLFVDPLRAYPARQYEHGVALATTGLNRTLPYAKSTDYVAGVRETIRARNSGCDEVVFVDREANLLEGTTFNVVAVIGERLLTPADAVLRGITCDHVLTLAAAAGFRVERTGVPLALLGEVDEVFITSSTREVIPVTRVAAQRIGDGQPGATTRRLHQLYRESARRLCARAAATPAGA